VARQAIRKLEILGYKVVVEEMDQTA